MTPESLNQCSIVTKIRFLDFLKDTEGFRVSMNLINVEFKCWDDAVSFTIENDKAVVRLLTLSII